MSKYELDRVEEQRRYDDRAKHIIAKTYASKEKNVYGALSVPLAFRGPYFFYEKKILENIRLNGKILEIASGVGTHTEVLLSALQGYVIATDISEHSLSVLKNHNSDKKIYFALSRTWSHYLSKMGSSI